MPLHLYSNAGMNLDIPAGAGSMGTINRQLAVIDGWDMPCVDFLKDVAERLGATDQMERMSHIYILVSKNTDPAICEQVKDFASQETPLLWVIPRMTYQEPVAITLPFVKALDWEVEA